MGGLGELYEEETHVGQEMSGGRRRRACLGWWEDFRSIFHAVRVGGEGCEFKKVLPDGGDTRFWKQFWANSELLGVKFNKLFRLSEQRENSVREMENWGVNGWEWDFKRSRPLLPREASLFNQLLNCINMYNLAPEKKDGWEWIHSRNDIYSTKEMYARM